MQAQSGSAPSASEGKEERCGSDMPKIVADLMDWRFRGAMTGMLLMLLLRRQQ